MNEATIKIKIRWFFFVYIELIKFLGMLNIQKGWFAYELMLKRLEKYPMLFFKIERSD